MPTVYVTASDRLLVAAANLENALQAVENARAQIERLESEETPVPFGYHEFAADLALTLKALRSLRFTAAAASDIKAMEAGEVGFCG